MIRKNFAFIAKSCTRMCSTVNEGAITVKYNLPPNLQLANKEVLNEPKPIPIAKKDYLFPILNVPQTIDVYQFSKPGSVITTVPLEKKIFEVAIRKDIVLDCIRYIRHKRRQPKKTKRKGEIRGSNKKPRPQKGGGNSQVGHRRNASWRGGHKPHGPVLRDYSIDINRKVRALGAMITLAAKFREGNLTIFDKLEPETHRTRDMQALLIAHGLSGEERKETILFVDLEIEKKFELASRNIPNVTTLEMKRADVYQILRRQKLCISSQAFQTIQSRLMAQYSHQGKYKAVLRSKALVERISNMNFTEENSLTAKN